MPNTPVANRRLFRNGFQRFQSGGEVTPMQPPMPMPQMPPQAPLMAPDAMMGDPNSAAMVEGVIADETATQVANVSQDIDNAQSVDDLLKTFGSDETNEETVRGDLADIVGAEDAMNTPESVLALVQPMLSMLEMEDEVATGGLGDLIPEPNVDDSLTAPTMPMLAENFNPVAGFKDGNEVDSDLIFNRNSNVRIRPRGMTTKRAYELLNEDLSEDHPDYINPELAYLMQAPDQIETGLSYNLQQPDFANIQKFVEEQAKMYDAIGESRAKELDQDSLVDKIDRRTKILKDRGLLIEPRSIEDYKARADAILPDSQSGAIMDASIAQAGAAIIGSKKSGFFEALLAGVPAISKGAMTAAAAKAARSGKIGDYALTAADKRDADVTAQRAELATDAIEEAVTLETDLEKAITDAQIGSVNKGIELEGTRVKSINDRTAAKYAQANRLNMQKFVAGKGTPNERIVMLDMTPEGGYIYDKNQGKQITRQEFEATYGSLEPFVDSETSLTASSQGYLKDAKQQVVTLNLMDPAVHKKLFELGIIEDETVLSELESRTGHRTFNVIEKDGNIFFRGKDGKLVELADFGAGINPYIGKRLSELASIKPDKDTGERVLESVLSGGREVGRSGFIGELQAGKDGKFRIKNLLPPATQKLVNGELVDLTPAEREEGLNREVPTGKTPLWQYINRGATYKQVDDPKNPGNKLMVYQDGNPFIQPNVYYPDVYPDNHPQAGEPHPMAGEVNQEESPSYLATLSKKDWKNLSSRQRQLYRRNLKQTEHLLNTSKTILDDIGKTIGPGAQWNRFLTGTISPITWGELRTDLISRGIGESGTRLRQWIRELVRSRMVTDRMALGEMQRIEEEVVNKETDKFMNTFFDSPEQGMANFTELLRHTQNKYNYWYGSVHGKHMVKTPRTPIGNEKDPFDLTIQGGAVHYDNNIRNVINQAKVLGINPEAAKQEFLSSKYIRIAKKDINAMAAKMQSRGQLAPDWMLEEPTLAEPYMVLPANWMQDLRKGN